MKSNKNLDRPRSERPYDKTTCSSVGVEDGRYGKDAKEKHMNFQSRRAEEMWGKKR